MKEIQDSTSNNILNQTICLSEKFGREVYVIGAGIVGGALREAVKHPLETVGETAAMTLAGAGLTAIAVAEIPVVSVAAVGTGALLAGKFVWDLADPNSVHNRERNLAFNSAFTAAWNGTDVNHAIRNLQDSAGRDSLYVFEGLLAGGFSTKFGARIPGAIRDRVPTWDDFQTQYAGADASVPTWKIFNRDVTPSYDYINFKKGDGPLSTFKMPPSSVDSFVAQRDAARVELDNLKVDPKMVEVKDSAGRPLSKDTETGELIQKRLPEPIGPDELPNRSHYFGFKNEGFRR